MLALMIPFVWFVGLCRTVIVENVEYDPKIPPNCWPSILLIPYNGLHWPTTKLEIPFPNLYQHNMDLVVLTNHECIIDTLIFWMTKTSLVLTRIYQLPHIYYQPVPTINQYWHGINQYAFGNATFKTFKCNYN